MHPNGGWGRGGATPARLLEGALKLFLGLDAGGIQVGFIFWGNSPSQRSMHFSVYHASRANFKRLVNECLSTLHFERSCYTEVVQIPLKKDESTHFPNSLASI